jgi:hypothetical protein
MEGVKEIRRKIPTLFGCCFIWVPSPLTRPSQDKQTLTATQREEKVRETLTWELREGGGGLDPTGTLTSVIDGRTASLQKKCPKL